MSMSEVAVGLVVDDALRAACEGDEDRRWRLVWRLQQDGGVRALNMASRLRDHDEPLYRALVADVLGQLGAGSGRPAVGGAFRDDALALLLTMVEAERDPVVLTAIAVGFGHIGDERCVEPLVRMHTHADTGVRGGVVFGLLGRPEPAALDTLITLSADREPAVRDWATFGLARQTTQDFPRLRTALADRLNDDDPDTRAEAIHGLAVRADERALEPLIHALQSPPHISDLNVIAEALYALAVATTDPRLHPYLVADHEDQPDDDVPEARQAALAQYAAAGYH